MDPFSKSLSRAGPAREALRVKGQFWTPDWIAEAMVAYVLASGSDSIFDPAVGAGAFFRAAKTIAQETGRRVKLFGSEIDPLALDHARQNQLNEEDLSQVQITHFVQHPPQGSFKAIVANPPYIRHHRLSAQEKAQLKAYTLKTMGFALDGRAGLHIYFLLQALHMLDHHGRLAFIMPADSCESIFAPMLWKWITQHYALDDVITFVPEASPFPHVDTNPIIFLIKHEYPSEHILWVKCCRPRTPNLKTWMLSDLQEVSNNDLQISRRSLSEGLSTGLSRVPRKEHDQCFTLADFARVLRGVATGSNEFFFLTSQQTAMLGIPQDFLHIAVGRTRDVPMQEITYHTIQELDYKGRPTLLFCPDGRPIDQFPHSVQEYLMQGEEHGLHKKPLISTRKPWYKMETRSVPPFPFAYLGRRNARFIRNVAGVIPLTVFLCVYPLHNDPAFVEKLWLILQHPDTVANLCFVGKSYGDGAIKVEPRALERLPIPASVVHAIFGISYQPDGQLRLLAS